MSSLEKIEPKSQKLTEILRFEILAYFRVRLHKTLNDAIHIKGKHKKRIPLAFTIVPREFKKKYKFNQKSVKIIQNHNFTISKKVTSCFVGIMYV